MLTSSNADPYIGLFDKPGVPVLFAYHGAGRWAPTPAYDSIADFLAAVRVEPASPSGRRTIELTSLLLTDLGPTPLKALVALRQLAGFDDLSPTEALALRDRLPLSLVSDAHTEGPLRPAEALLTPLGVTLERRSRTVET